MQEYYIVNNVFKGYPDEPDKVTIGDYFKGHDQDVDYDSIEEFIIQQLINCNTVEIFYDYIGYHYQEGAAMFIDLISYSHLNNSDDILEEAIAKEDFWIDLILEYFGAFKSHDTIKKHNRIFKSLENVPHMRYLGPEEGL